jgi:hypothetical protein
MSAFSFECPAGKQLIYIAGGPAGGMDMLQLACEGGTTAQYGNTATAPAWDIEDHSALLGLTSGSDANGRSSLNAIGGSPGKYYTIWDIPGGIVVNQPQCPKYQYMYKVNGVASASKVNSISYQCRSAYADRGLPDPVDAASAPNAGPAVTVVIPGGILTPAPISNPVDTTIAGEPTFGAPVATAPAKTILPMASQTATYGTDYDMIDNRAIVFIFLFLFICIIAGIYLVLFDEDETFIDVGIPRGSYTSYTV